MNYRHAYHAGNFADCMKHALLLALLKALGRKPAPFFALDTHAGRGEYDLTSEQARRTNEAASGIARLLDDTPLALAEYVSLAERPGPYPGSPMVIRAMLRPGDHLACCEAHPEDASALRALFRRDAQVSVHQRDGWEGLKALLPPKQKRGLVLIDPPYEDPGEFSRLTEGLALANARFPGAMLAAWYPVKHRAPVRAFFDSLTTRDTIAAELLLREPLDPTRLNGCGLAIVNPPWRFEEEAMLILDSLLDRLGSREPGEAATITRLAYE